MSPALDTQLRRLRLARMAPCFEAQNTVAIRDKHACLKDLTSLVDGGLEPRCKVEEALHRMLQALGAT